MQSYGAKSIYGSDIPREGELLALIPEDILPSMQLNICKTFAVVDVEQVTLTPKTNRSKRIVTIPEFLYNEIEEHISKLYEIKKNDRIFMFTKSSLIGEIKTLAAKAGVKQIRVHDLRHPYVKHTTKKYNSEKQKTQATKMDLIAWGFCFCIVSYSKRSWTL